MREHERMTLVLPHLFLLSCVSFRMSVFASEGGAPHFLQIASANVLLPSSHLYKAYPSFSLSGRLCSQYVVQTQQLPGVFSHFIVSTFTNHESPGPLIEWQICCCPLPACLPSCHSSILQTMLLQTRVPTSA